MPSWIPQGYVEVNGKNQHSLREAGDFVSVLMPDTNLNFPETLQRD